MVEDRRTPEQVKGTRIFVVATDSFLSGWGKASNGKSYYAVACPSNEVADDVERRMRTRNDFKRVRTAYHPRCKRGDHLAIVWHEKFSYGK